MSRDLRRPPSGSLSLPTQLYSGLGCGGLRTPGPVETPTGPSPPALSRKRASEPESDPLPGERVRVRGSAHARPPRDARRTLTPALSRKRAREPERQHHAMRTTSARASAPSRSSSSPPTASAPSWSRSAPPPTPLGRRRARRPHLVPLATGAAVAGVDGKRRLTPLPGPLLAFTPLEDMLWRPHRLRRRWHVRPNLQCPIRCGYRPTGGGPRHGLPRESWGGTCLL